MFGIDNYGVFILSAVLLNITPGTDTMYIMSRSISQGKKAGIYSALGISLGSVVHTLLAAFGLSIILTQSLLLFTLVKIMGAAYLVYLGIKMLMAKRSNQNTIISEQTATFNKIFIQGLLTNITNPKVALFFLAFIPQFIDGSQSGPIPFLLLGLTFCCTGGFWNILVAVFSSTVTKKLRNNSSIEFLLNKAMGFVFIAISVELLRAKVSE
ncbi:LysE family translocator [Bacillus massilinigeriensis]|uniref:LysE family translocator n=1 Tax=Bacillus massilionigeriensis TaxID=1805475 RepID=UPI00096AE134|nr:LysE family translocator [Bacillus massilionigeriensis]